ncbi:hypothetical protein HAPAU_01280 [Halalkalicoccus paucihalophilus]|uniref:Halobacterial output domain-containing protein n=2 Tax=Halalkalicoccus paucihalophilus TaxID=1008153 RepID=A0A151AIX4_9EURY|nr:hypothetical protein HAPAU_01280 [Halalkalicoccus paucihalophilus]
MKAIIYLYMKDNGRTDYVQVGGVRTKMTDDGDRQNGLVGEDEPRVYQTTHDFESRRALSTTVIEAIEEAVDVEGPSSRVLADVIDPDCLDGLFRPVRHRTDRDNGVVQFPLEEHRITVYATGEIELRRIED